MSKSRPVFYVSDGTGITAETIGHSLLTQFANTEVQTDRIPFVDGEDKAMEAAARIRTAGEVTGQRPIVISSCVDTRLTDILASSGALILDVFAPFIEPLERELGEQRQSQVGHAHGLVNFESYHRRINAMKATFVFKDVTYEMLKEPGFGKTISEHFPDLEPLEEYTAAKESSKDEADLFTH